MKTKTNKNNVKYYFVSDLHGTHPKHLILAILKQGFVNGDISHQLVVAGDITDGLGNDEKLINCLREFEKSNQLIVVKGNHDDWTIQNETMNPVDLSDDNLKWLKKIPYQVETEHFYLAHGIYTKKLKDKIKDKKTLDYLSTWGSPCLIGFEAYDWWHIKKIHWEKIHDKWKTLKDYIKDHDDKDMYIGHFWPNIVVEKLEYLNDSYNKDIKFSEDEKGFVSIEGKIHYLDSNVLKRVPIGSLKVKVVIY